MKTVDEITTEILSEVKSDINKLEGSYTYDLARAEAIAIADVYLELEDLKLQLFPFTATEDWAIDLWMKFFGLTRNEPSKASGLVHFKGKPNSVIAKGTIVVSKLGAEYETVTNLTLSANGLGDVEVVALEGGIDGNCGIGDIDSLEIATPDVYVVENLAKFTNGFPLETVESTHERMQFKASTPAHSGNKNEYVLWAKEVSGVGEVLVLGAGEEVETGVTVPAGEVNVYLADNDLKPVTTTVINNVKTYIEDDRRPVGAIVNVASFTAKVINITVQVKHDSTTDKTTVQTKLIEKLTELFKQISFTDGDIVSVGKIGKELFNVDGVLDYKALSINGSTSSLSLKKYETANLGTTVVTDWI